MRTAGGGSRGALRGSRRKASAGQSHEKWGSLLARGKGSLGRGRSNGKGKGVGSSLNGRLNGHVEGSIPSNGRANGHSDLAHLSGNNGDVDVDEVARLNGNGAHPVEVEQATHLNGNGAIPEVERLPEAPPLPAAAPGPSETRKATRREVFRRDARYRRGLAVADVISAASAVWLTFAVLGDRDVLNPSLLLALPLVVLVSKVIGLYDRDEHVLHKTTLDEVPAIFQVATLYTLLIWLTEGISVQGHLGHAQILFLWSVLFVFMVLGRAAARWVVQLGSPIERCLVIGDALAAKSVEHKFKQNRSVKAIVVGRVALTSHEAHGAAPPLLGDVRSLSKVLTEHRIQRVVVAPGLTDSQEILDVIRRVKIYGVKVSVLPRLFEVIGSSVRFDDIQGLTLLGMNRDGLTKSSEILKRSMDIVGAAVGLTLLSPFLLGIAAAIRLTSPGPALFRQRRIGRDGAEFELRKFRTMVDGADTLKPALFELNESDGFFKIADDPRITRLGRFLRQTYLDELPQLINVLRGDMSLVGPRPLVPDEDVRIEGWQRNRLLLKPGMTGHWQIFGASRVPMREMVKIDYLYGANWSLWLDTKILLRTVPYVVRRSGQ